MVLLLVLLLVVTGVKQSQLLVLGLRLEFDKTPEPVVFFQAGKLPGEAMLHLKQLTLFGMICQLVGNILNNLALKLHQPRSKATKTGLLKFAPIVLFITFHTHLYC